MAAFSSIALGVTAAAAVGSAVYGMTRKRPSVPPPPPPASYYSYDEDGNPAGEQVWDPKRNAYVYKPAPLTEEQKAEREKKKEIRTQMLSNLAATPEDRIRAYEDYARTFSDVMHRDVDKRYRDIVRLTDESMEARGMTGSRAYADTIAQLARDKQETDVAIAEKAALAKEQLAQADRDYWLRVIAELDAGRRSDYLAGLQKEQAALQAAQMGTAGIMAQYNINALNKLRKWEADQERIAAMTNALGGLAGTLGMAKLYNTNASPMTPPKVSSQAAGLSYLYGYKKPTLSYTKPSWMY